MFGKSESSRSALTRLQRQAPTSLNLVCVPQNHFLQQSCDAVETTELFLCFHLSLFLQICTLLLLLDKRTISGFIEERFPTDDKESWQYSAKA
ncbi:hypothetical protein YC2023_097427 [Brassica napus]